MHCGAPVDSNKEKSHHAWRREVKSAATKPDPRQTGLIEIREVDIVLLPHPRFRNGQFN
jgi:hypothetical protein